MLEPDTKSPAKVDEDPSLAAPTTRVAPPDGEATWNQAVSASAVTAHQALHPQEIRNTRVFVRLAFAVATLVALTLPVLRGDGAAKLVLLASLSAVWVYTGWFAWQLRQDQGYTAARATACSFITTIATFAGLYFFGVLSGAAAVVCFGLWYFGIGESRRGTLALFLACAGLQAALTLLIIVGALPDVGLIRVVDGDRAMWLASLVLIEAIYLATFVFARASRAATLHAIDLHEQAVRHLAAREALLAEAHNELAHARMARGIGRFTDQTLGSFKLGGIIGRGAMGEVYEGRHVETGERAAVKLLHPHSRTDPALVERFFRETRIAGALNVPNVVRVLEVAPTGAAEPYLAMELLEGQDLAELLRERTLLPTREVQAIVRDVGAGLDAAGKAGIVHRDLKPRNLFRAHARGGPAAGVWKILDFGVSKLLSDETTLTQGMLVGTPAYMAPEQVAFGVVSPRSDLFALALVAYRALTGRPAFSGESDAEIVFKVVQTTPARPGEIISLVPELDLFFAIALAKEPNSRFASGHDLAEAFEDAAEGRMDRRRRALAEDLVSKRPWGSRMIRH